MTIYKTLLGTDFDKLHPKLQKRYSIPVGKPFFASGTMTKIESGASWLKPFLQLATRWQFLFPETGRNVPFTVKNTCRTLPTGEAEIYWERTFYFEKVTRHFNAFMTIDPKRRIVKDYLGEPSLFYSDLQFEVTPEGHQVIRSGRQRFILGPLEIPIPKMLEGVVTVEDGYDDAREVFTVQVHIHNRIVGKVMVYEGEYKEESL
ncbi:DUF4166 domain-containing protein [Fictibacillus nanhaiensis]|uniref:DUF4166 domain-containing protein n=1 Tax=Fictibacillus nanhaiensis TaxID=742169 RepID=UPI001C94E50C|nr:DUF4166 domain-containing protein [Fictibacillus nanhaiensis]MBY6037129.1 DUF4166 domain-containing protein [Fictibacillus nanhaiensis]